MEEGSLRCDANISLRPSGTSELGTKTELKNMNSFRFIERGIRAEIARQETTLQAGERVMQETLHFDPASGAITSLRSKEEAHDYRYFPEPDLVPVAIEQAMLDGAAVRRWSSCPRTCGAIRERNRPYGRERRRSWPSEASWATTSRRRCSSESTSPAQTLANWISERSRSRALEDGTGRRGVRWAPRYASSPRIAALAGLVASKQISVGAGARCSTGWWPKVATRVEIVEVEGLAAIGGAGDELAAIVAAALEANADAAERVRGGNAKAIGPIVGYVMRETKGRADGGEVTRLVNEQLGI